MDTNDQKRALFKFKLIAPILNEPKRSQKNYLASMAAKKHLPPGGDHGVFFSIAAMKKWLRLYRQQGFEGLLPHPRKDKGASRKIPAELGQRIADVLQSYEFRTIKTLYEYLIDTAMLTRQQCTYATLANYLNRHRLLKNQRPGKARKSFEKAHINMLWVGDFMYGPYITANKRKERSYLFAVLDDHSRFPVGAAFSIRQNTVAMESVLKKAMLTYGLPQKLYLDNGKVFVEQSLVLAGARLGFSIVHSEVGDPASRGKIERFFRTVRDRFLDRFMFDYRAPVRPDLPTLSAAFAEWLNTTYLHAEHSSLADSPHNRFMADMQTTALRTAPENKIRRAFYHEYRRKVGNSALVSVDNVEYEVPGKYIGQTITLYYDIDCEEDVLFLFENDAPDPLVIKPVDRHLNAEFPIRFNSSF